MCKHYINFCKYDIHFQIVKGYVQKFSVKPFEIITFNEQRLRIAREKLRINPYTVLHVDTTSGVVKKVNNKEVYFSAASFSGRDERSKTVGTRPSDNHPPFVVGDMLSTMCNKATYRQWLELIDDGLHKVSNGM